MLNRFEMTASYNRVLPLKTNVIAALSLALIGIIFLAGGVATSLGVTSSKATCEACGMIVDKDDISALKIVLQDGSEHWGCCPICAEVVGLYYVNDEINAKCFVSGTPIKIVIENGNFSSASATPATGEVMVVAGGACAKNKIVASQTYAEQVKNTYDWASNASIKTVPQSFVAASTKLSDVTPSTELPSIPAVNYIMIGVGVVLLAAAPLSFKLLNTGKSNLSMAASPQV
jgi:hypothetical protein